MRRDPAALPTRDSLIAGERWWFTRKVDPDLLVRAAMVTCFISSLVTANLLVTRFGPWALPFTAFFLIGFDLTIRDALHEAWHKKNLAARMAVLIAAGAIIALLLNRNALWVGIGSFTAFAAAQTTNTLIYALMYKRPWLTKVNTSNSAAALVDSTVFTLVAFHTFLPLIILTQWGIKFGGGFFWSLIVKRLRVRYPVLRGLPLKRENGLRTEIPGPR